MDVRMSIPKSRLILPGNYIVKIRFYSKVRMEGEHGDSDGCWDVDTHTIYIGKHLSLARQKYIFRHELVHAVNDWFLYFDYCERGWNVGAVVMTQSSIHS